MRIHPIIIEVVRAPIEDDVLPLTKPIVGTSGKVYTELPIPKGTPVGISTIGYNMCVFHLVTFCSAELSYHCPAAGTETCGAQMHMYSGRNVGSKWTDKWNHPLECMEICMVARYLKGLSVPLTLICQRNILRRRQELHRMAGRVR